jgi:hypothetical protein
MREVWLAAGGAALPSAAFPILCSAAAVGVALALHRYLEPPIERTMRDLLDPPRPWLVLPGPSSQAAARSTTAGLTRASGVVIADSRP